MAEAPHCPTVPSPPPPSTAAQRGFIHAMKLHSPLVPPEARTARSAKYLLLQLGKELCSPVHMRH